MVFLNKTKIRKNTGENKIKFYPYKLFLSVLITGFCILSLKTENEKLDKFNYYLTEFLSQNSSWENLKNNTLSLCNYIQNKSSGEASVQVSASLIEDIQRDNSLKK